MRFLIFLAALLTTSLVTCVISITKQLDSLDPVLDALKQEIVTPEGLDAIQEKILNYLEKSQIILSIIQQSIDQSNIDTSVTN